MIREMIFRRRDLLLAQERGNPCQWFYLSFADATGFLKFELHETEVDALMLALGYATGAAHEKHEPLSQTFLMAANAVNRGNPHWKIYQIPDGLKMADVIREFMASLPPKKAKKRK